MRGRMPGSHSSSHQHGSSNGNPGGSVGRGQAASGAHHSHRTAAQMQAMYGRGAVGPNGVPLVHPSSHPHPGGPPMQTAEGMPQLRMPPHHSMPMGAHHSAVSRGMAMRQQPGQMQPQTSADGMEMQALVRGSAAEGVDMPPHSHHSNPMMPMNVLNPNNPYGHHPGAPGPGGMPNPQHHMQPGRFGPPAA